MLYNRNLDSQREEVRRLAFLYLLFCVVTVQAQEQERNLIDRLLRPNMDLQNPQQGKPFRADSKVTGRAGHSEKFTVEPTAKGKTFADSRAIQAKEYRSRSVRADSQRNAYVESREVSLPTQSTSTVRGLHPAYDANQNVSGRRFGEDRTFRDQGKSQKSLSRKTTPLTIDQVRDLLNKNK